MPTKLNLDEAEIIRLYTEEHKSSGSIAEIFGCSAPPVLAVLHRRGVSVNKGRTKSWIKTKDIVRLYQEDLLSSDAIAQRLSCTPSLVLKRLRKARIPLRKSGQRPKKINAAIFDNIDSEEKAYWLGFLYADGYIHVPSNRPSPRVGLGISEKDVEHLKKYRCFLKPEHEVVHDKTIVTLHVNNRHLVARLMELGICPQKSYNYQGLPDIPADLLRHYLRGVFDGDGHVGIRKGRYGDIPVVHLVGHRECLSDIRDIFVSFTNHCPKITKPTAAKSDRVGEMRWGAQRDTSNILKYLYDNTSVFLERKKAKANEIIGRWGHV